MNYNSGNSEINSNFITVITVIIVVNSTIVRLLSQRLAGPLNIVGRQYGTRLQ